MGAYLRVEGLSKAYRTTNDEESVLALNNVDFTITQGSFVSLLGPSGCGKTTLLRTVAGLEAATKGRIVLNDQPIINPGPEIGMVFQEHRLFPWLSVQDNVSYGLARQGMSKDDQRRLGTAYLDLVGLSKFARHYPKELSIGMSQRVGIARALATDPDILLMDEPFASVDAQTRRELQRELLRIWNKTGKTVLFVTHSVDEAILLSQRIIILSANPGRIARIIEFNHDYPRDETSIEFNEVKRDILSVLQHH